MANKNYADTFILILYIDRNPLNWTLRKRQKDEFLIEVLSLT